MPSHNLSDSQLARLPLFARREIERLAGDLGYWKAKAAEGSEDSDTFADRIIGVSDFAGRPLGKGTRVVFQYGPDERDAVTVHTDGRGAVDIRTGRNLLLVIPQGSNAIRVHGSER